MLHVSNVYDAERARQLRTPPTQNGPIGGKPINLRFQTDDQREPWLWFPSRVAAAYFLTTLESNLEQFRRIRNPKHGPVLDTAFEAYMRRRLVFDAAKKKKIRNDFVFFDASSLPPGRRWPMLRKWVKTFCIAIFWQKVTYAPGTAGRKRDLDDFLADFAEVDR